MQGVVGHAVLAFAHGDAPRGVAVRCTEGITVDNRANRCAPATSRRRIIAHLCPFPVAPAQPARTRTAHTVVDRSEVAGVVVGIDGGGRTRVIERRVEGDRAAGMRRRHASVATP